MLRDHPEPDLIHVDPERTRDQALHLLESGAPKDLEREARQRALVGRATALSSVPPPAGVRAARHVLEGFWEKERGGAVRWVEGGKRQSRG